MPLLKLETTVAVPDDQRQRLLTSLSHIVSETTGKPEQYVMITISSAAMLMAGKTGHAAFVDVRGIGGLTDAVNRRLSQQVCQLVKDALGVASDRVYMNFTEVEAGHWGWDGSTFG
jgi:phenylpyruvate tautomerase